MIEEWECDACADGDCNDCSGAPCACFEATCEAATREEVMEHMEWLVAMMGPMTFMQASCGCTVEVKDGRINVTTPKEVPDWVNNPRPGATEQAERWLDAHGF